ncbi:MAG TPA: hypothetical protein VIG64_05790 [Actinomycetota bacterium]|jgi:protein-tyrosine phosphatase
MLRILYVCTGNRCRSPFAAADLTALTEGLPVHAESAGTTSLGPVPPTADSIRTAAARGVDVSSHRARWIQEVDATAFDLVLGFERNHVAAAVVEGGVPYGRAFLLPELHRLLRDIPTPQGADFEEAARAAIRAAHDARGTSFVPGEEVSDPIGKPAAVYEEVFSQIAELNEDIASALFDSTSTRVPEPVTSVPAFAVTAEPSESLTRDDLWDPLPPAEPVERDDLWGPRAPATAPGAGGSETPPAPDDGRAPVASAPIEANALWGPGPDAPAEGVPDFSPGADDEPAESPIPEATST